MTKSGLRIFGAVLLTGGALGLLGQTADPSPQDIAVQLGSDKPADVAGAMALIHARLNEEPRPTASQIRAYWLKPLLNKGRKAEALDLCVGAICAAPEQTGLVDALQRQRITILSEMGRHEEALSQAKALFNFCPPGSTEQALLLLADCADAARGDDSDFVDRLISEERAGAAPAEKAVVSSTLRELPVDAAPYQKALRRFRLPSGDLPIAPADLVAVGNLSLLADNPATALAAFRKLAQVGGAADLHVAEEGIARAMRAQDGTVGRANHYMQSLAP